MARWEIKVFYDGACPICRKEAAFLRWLDGGRQKLLLEDINAPDFDPARYEATMEQVMGQIHGVLPSGRLVTGMAVLRRTYDAVGLGWITAPTNWPVLRPLFDAGYRWFADHRLWLTGRFSPCHSSHCRTPHKTG